LKLTREVKTGIFAVISILLFILGYNFLKGSDLFTNSRVFYSKYDNVAGLTTSSPVTVNGMRVGQVQNVFLDSKRGGKVVVEFTIDTDFEFSKSSTIQIYSSGFIGGNNLGVLPNYEDPVMAVSGDTIQGQMQAGMIDGILEKFTPIEKSILSTLSKLDTVMINLNSILDEKTKTNIKQSISHLNQTMASFNQLASNTNEMIVENKDKIGRSMENLDVTTANFAKLSDSLAQIETTKMMADLESAISKFNAIATQIENGDGSVGMLLKDEKLYNNLEGASKQLEQLLQDMKLNPKRYVHFSLFGKKPKEYEVPDDPEK